MDQKGEGVTMRLQSTNAQIRSDTTRSATILVLTVVAAIGVTIAIVEAQRETAPAGVTNYTRVDATVACAGATPVQALPEIKKNGFVSVVNFRMPTEQGANIDEAKATAAQVGLKYIHLPFQTPTPEIADAFLKSVADPANQPMYIHCASANRVGAMWFIKRVKLDGWDVERAMKEAEGIGLRAPNLKEFALTYVGAKR
jgi:uncharacterized protein (TIGR01244 family)